MASKETVKLKAELYVMGTEEPWEVLWMALYLLEHWKAYHDVKNAKFDAAEAKLTEAAA